MTTPLSYMKDHIQVLQSELDKANARIAQLEKALKIELEVHDAYLGAEYSAGSQRDLHGKLLTESNDTWLSQHDKAVEVKVLEEAFHFICEHPESTPYFEDDVWKTPYLISNAGGFGGGVGDRHNATVREALIESRK